MLAVVRSVKLSLALSSIVVEEIISLDKLFSKLSAGLAHELINKVKLSNPAIMLAILFFFILISLPKFGNKKSPVYSTGHLGLAHK